MDAEHRPHGEGCWLFTDGRVKTKGTFADGRLTKGFCEWPNGGTFDGEWKDGSPHGEGKFIKLTTLWKSGRIDEGQFVTGQLVKGVRTYTGLAIGCKEEGSFDNNKLHGSACIITGRRSRYEGDVRFGLRDGVGAVNPLEDTLLAGDTRDNGQATDDADLVWSVTQMEGLSWTSRSHVACGKTIDAGYRALCLERLCPLERCLIPTTLCCSPTAASTAAHSMRRISLTVPAACITEMALRSHAETGLQVR